MWVYMLGATVSCLQPTFVIAQNGVYLSVFKKKMHFFPPVFFIQFETIFALNNYQCFSSPNLTSSGMKMSTVVSRSQTRLGLQVKTLTNSSCLKGRGANTLYAVKDQQSESHGVLMVKQFQTLFTFSPSEQCLEKQGANKKCIFSYNV